MKIILKIRPSTTIISKKETEMIEIKTQHLKMMLFIWIYPTYSFNNACLGEGFLGFLASSCHYLL